jgi:hypothetical protein
LADFAALALNIGPVLGIGTKEVTQLLEGMDSEKAEFGLEHNSLYPLLVTWLENGGMKGRECIDSKTLFEEIQDQWTSRLKFPYGDAAVLSRKLNNIKTELKGLIEVEKISRGCNKTVWRIHPGSKLVLTPKEKKKGPPWS